MNERIEEKIVLLRNLMARIEYNEKQHNYKISGAITQDEFQALRESYDALLERARRSVT